MRKEEHEQKKMKEAAQPLDHRHQHPSLVFWPERLEKKKYKERKKERRKETGKRGKGVKKNEEAIDIGKKGGKKKKR